MEKYKYKHLIVSEELHSRFKAFCASHNQKLGSTVSHMIEELLAKNSVRLDDLTKKENFDKETN